MTKKEIEIKDVLVYEDAPYGNIDMAKGIWEQIPAHMIEWNDRLAGQNYSYARASEYRFEHCGLLDYFVLKLYVDDNFVFEKFYPLNNGFNMELIDVLEKARAFKIVSGAVDFDAVIEHDFYFSYEKCPDTYMYRICDVEIDPESYEDKIHEFYDCESVFNDVMEKMKNEKTLFHEDMSSIFRW